MMREAIRLKFELLLPPWIEAPLDRVSAALVAA